MIYMVAWPYHAHAAIAAHDQPSACPQCGGARPTRDAPCAWHGKDGVVMAVGPADPTAEVGSNFAVERRVGQRDDVLRQGRSHTAWVGPLRPDQAPLAPTPSLRPCARAASSYGNPIDAGLAFAREFTGYGLAVLAFSRAAVRRALDRPIHEGLKIEADLSTLAFRTADTEEGMAAFEEKRKPRFRDA
jgi:hypothetical protein